MSGKDSGKAKPVSEGTATGTAEMALAGMVGMDPDAMEAKVRELAEQRQMLNASAAGLTQDKHRGLFAQILADEVIADQRLLEQTAGVYMDEFVYMLIKLEGRFKRDLSMPLLRDDIVKKKAGNPGNRSKMLLRHMLLVTLDYHRSRTLQNKIARDFDMDQSTISRTIKLISDNLDKILPTPERMKKKILKSKTQAEAEELVPDLLLAHDGMVTRVRRPGNSDGQGRYAPGTKGSLIAGTVFTVSKSGLFINMGKTAMGRMHSMNEFGKSLSKLAKHIARLQGDKQVRGFADGGFQGGSHAQAIQTPRRKDNGLASDDMKYNEALVSERIITENAFAQMRRYNILRDSNYLSLAELDRTLNRVAGLLNLHHAMDHTGSEDMRHGG